MAIMHHIPALGGIGNRLNAWLSAEAYGLRCLWRPDKDANPRPEDLLMDVPAYSYTLAEATNSPLPPWRFPGINVDNLPAEHPPVDRASYHWMHRMPPCQPPPRRKPRAPDLEIPPGCVGFSLRLLHPQNRCAQVDAVRAINEASELGPVFVASDAAVTGLSDAVLVNNFPRRGAYDGDRDPARTSAEWRALCACSTIRTSLVNSTFTNYATFVLKTPTIALCPF